MNLPVTAWGYDITSVKAELAKQDAEIAELKQKLAGVFDLSGWIQEQKDLRAKLDEAARIIHNEKQLNRL